MGRCAQKGSLAGGDAHEAAGPPPPPHDALQRAEGRNWSTGGSAGGSSPRHTHRAAQSTSRPRSASQGAVPCLGARGIVRGVAARSWVNRRAPQPRDPGLPHDRGSATTSHRSAGRHLGKPPRRRCQWASSAHAPRSSGAPFSAADVVCSKGPRRSARERRQGSAGLASGAKLRHGTTEPKFLRYGVVLVDLFASGTPGTGDGF